MNNHGLFLSKEEIYLFNKGRFFHSYLKFGAHVIEYEGISGIHFAVWAPNAVQVNIVGDFNNWEGLNYSMKPVEQTGVWTLFVPDLKEGYLYKYEIHTADGKKILKADPFAFYSEVRPGSASIIYSLEGYEWNDYAWIKHSAEANFKEEPMAVYEVHLGSWKKKEDDSYFNYQELAKDLLDYAIEMGYTHIELMPLMEHPYDGSWGYQCTGYYSCSSRYGNPKELMYFIDSCHQAGVGVILDWVPGHFCKDSHGLGRFDGTPIYENEEHEQWGTYKFDFAKPEVQSFLISNAVFWFDKFHVDGLRVDGVSSMLYLDYGKEGRFWKPNIYGGRENLFAVSFIQQLNEVVFKYFPRVLMIAEEATDWPLVSWPTYINGLGFSLKWNMGWMNDTLKYMQLDFTERKYNHNLLSFSLMYAFSENFVLPLSHDEVVHGKKSLLNKMPGDYYQKFAGLRCLYTYLICHPGKKLFFMGGELAQFIEWRDDKMLDWLLLDYEMHQMYQTYTKCINKLYQSEKALWQNDHNEIGFEWIDANNNEQSIIVFFRRAKETEDFLIVIINFLPTMYEKYRIGVPANRVYIELFNSDRASFGGTNYVNEELLKSEKIPWQGREFSTEITVPPLGVVILKPKSDIWINNKVIIPN